MDKEAKVDYFIVFISKHPELSGNQIYNKFKGSKYGMRKKDFYKVYRNTKGLGKPSEERSFKAVPKKYKRVVKRDIRKERRVVESIPSSDLRKKEYSPFFEAVETMVYHKMDRYPDNLRDLQYNMYRFNLNAGGWPSDKQVYLAWKYLKTKGLTSR